VDLTLREFKIVTLLAEKAGRDVGYREIYDLVHGKDFVAGQGSEGYRANVCQGDGHVPFLNLAQHPPASRAETL
jgi:hypothetical protein